MFLLVGEVVLPSPHRAQAALEYLLLERADEGHVFTPNAELVQMCRSRFDLPEELLTAAVGSLRKAGRIVLDGEAVFLRGLYLAQRAVADSINPNPPMDTDGRREGSRRGVRELLG